MEQSEVSALPVGCDIGISTWVQILEKLKWL